MVNRYKELAKTQHGLILIVGFISFYITVKFFSNIVSFVSKHIAEAWAEPVAMVVAYFFAVFVLPLAFFILYFKFIKGQ